MIQTEEFVGTEYSKPSNKLTVFPTSYFPSIAYLKAICAAEYSIIDIGEHYTKQTFRNRCSILTANGGQGLSIPVIRPNGNKSSTSIVKVSPEINWRRDHWRTISAAYASSPYFEHYEEEIKLLIFQETELLVDFNQKCLEFLIKSLSLPLNIKYSKEYMESSTNDFRSFFFAKTESKYQQVFNPISEFSPNLSVLDALFCIGPMARTLITE